jgi:(1->4)-alpha-D-glucan 1-alpha-D-glucosylmutase
VLAAAVAAARPLAAPGEAGQLDQIAAWLGGEGEPALRAEAARRLQQLSAPVSAKAVEDTAFYRYGRLISRNDVGSDPARLSSPPEAFHAAARARQERFPHALLATATHDHKRGEDVTARLAVLSERPGDWIEHAALWTRINREVPSPISPGDEYILYQTLAGAWPLDLKPDDALGLKDWGERLGEWMRKALREAKLKTSWAAPDGDYEAGCQRFLEDVLDPERSASFLEDLHGFVEAIAPAGALNSLAQTLLRCTVPGVPDLYQGCEVWDFSLVDPDNRRPVDFGALAGTFAADAPLERLLPSWRDGRIKQALIARALRLRAAHPGLLQEGDYVPLQIEGRREASLIAFLRRAPGRTLLVAAPIRCAEAVTSGVPATADAWWGDTRIRLPDGAAPDHVLAIGVPVALAGMC